MNPRRLVDDRRHLWCFGVLGAIELAMAGFAIAGEGWWAAPAWVAGVGAWTLVEYVLHRGLFHLPTDHILAGLGATHHHAHHRAPNQAPITKPLVLTLPPIAIATGLSATWGPLAVAVVAGSLAGYFAYEVCHVAAHLLGDAHPLPGLRDAHLAHHVGPSRGFGISTTIWDRVFGTRIEADAPIHEIARSARLAERSRTSVPPHAR